MQHGSLCLKQQAAIHSEGEERVGDLDSYSITSAHPAKWTAYISWTLTDSSIMQMGDHNECSAFEQRSMKMESLQHLYTG